jgi:NADH-ubiquinone oxidoreductase chain 5
MNLLLLSIIILPFIGTIASGLFGWYIGKSGSKFITCTCVSVSAILAVIAFYYVAILGNETSIYICDWLNIETLNIGWSFYFDTLTVSMLLPVLIVSSLVHIYAVEYMAEDPHQPRFFSYLSMFTSFMVILVTADNYLVLFVGWELIGVCSYLLIAFWYTRLQAMKSALSAILLNRFGDTFLTIGLFATLWTFGNLDFATIFALSGYINESVLNIIGICFLLGAMAKSAQLGPHMWLSLAMEGPTPVSALLHAATMVNSCCRRMIKIILLLFCYLLELPYIKFIYTLIYYHYITKMDYNSVKYIKKSYV